MIIELREDLYLDKSKFRKCYQHPEQENCIIKIQRNDLDPSDAEPNNREIEFYKKLTDNKYFAKFFGVVETSFGKGLMFEKILNHDGTKPVRFLESYRKGEKLSKKL